MMAMACVSSFESLESLGAALPACRQAQGKRLGPLPHYGLKEARARADTHRALIREGIDPLTHKADVLQQAEAARIAREMNLENTFRACAVDYIEA